MCDSISFSSSRYIFISMDIGISEWHPSMRPTVRPKMRHTSLYTNLAFLAQVINWNWKSTYRRNGPDFQLVNWWEISCSPSMQHTLVFRYHQFSLSSITAHNLFDFTNTPGIDHFYNCPYCPRNCHTKVETFSQCFIVTHNILPVSPNGIDQAVRRGVFCPIPDRLLMLWATTQQQTIGICSMLLWIECAQRPAFCVCLIHFLSALRPVSFS